MYKRPLFIIQATPENMKDAEHNVRFVSMGSKEQRYFMNWYHSNVSRYFEAQRADLPLR